MKKILVVGSLNIDFVVKVEDMPLVGETLLAKEMELIPGGKGANQAFTLGRLGADVTMLGAVGNDMYGQMQIENLSSAGVDVSHLLKLDGINTGIALITVNQKGDNNIIVIQGANKLVSKEYIDKKLDLIKECDIVIFQLEIPLETVMYAAQKAKEFGKTVILDPAPAPKHLPDELLRNVDIIKPNETELATLIGMADAESNLEEAAELLKARGVGCVLGTLGGDGAFASLPDGTTHRAYCQPVEVVDTTAAGDSFTAAMAASIANGKDIISSMEFANQVASIVVTRKGAQSSIPTLAEVDEFIKRSRLP